MKRYSFIDILKAIAIFCVVLGHILDGTLVERYIYSFQVPLFFFVSGMLFRDKKEGFTAFLKKRFASLMIPYYVFGIISILIYAVLGKVAAAALGTGEIQTDILPNLYGLLYGSSGTGLLKYNLPLWFLPCLFVTELLFYGLYRLCRKSEKPVVMQISVTALIALAAALVNFFLHVGDLPLGLNSAFTMIVFYSLGNLLSASIISFSQQHDAKKEAVMAVVLLVIGAVAGCMNERVHYSVNQYHNYLLFYLGALASIGGYVALSMLIDHNRVLEYVGKRTLGILVMHKFPILFFQTIVSFTAVRLKNNDLVMSVVIALVSIIMCLAADWIIDRYLGFMYGRFKKKTINN